MTDTRSKIVNALYTEKISAEQMERAYLLLTTVAPKLPESQSLGFLTIQEAMEYGKISRNTLYRWLTKGLKSYPVGGRRLLLATDIEQFVFSQSTPPANPPQGVLNHE